MNVRKLRISVPASGRYKNGIDEVTDPAMLAHRLLKLDCRSESRYFDHKIRVSALHNVCVRGQLLGLRNNATSQESLPVSMRLTFDIGNAIHHYLQNSNEYLGSNRLGWWKCLACGNKVFGRKPTSRCSSCGSLESAFCYVEHALKLPENILVSGHIDCFLEVSPGDIRILDFKTINGDEFQTLSAPKPEHCIQVNGYMKYCKLDTSLPIKVNGNSGLLLYISKKHCGNSLPLKMFHVPASKMYLDVIEGKVANFARGLADRAWLPDPLPHCLASRFKASASRTCTALSYCIAAFESDGR